MTINGCCFLSTDVALGQAWQLNISRITRRHPTLHTTTEIIMTVIQTATTAARDTGDTGVRLQNIADVSIHIVLVTLAQLG